MITINQLCDIENITSNKQLKEQIDCVFESNKNKSFKKNRNCVKKGLNDFLLALILQDKIIPNQVLIYEEGQTYVLFCENETNYVELIFDSEIPYNYGVNVCLNGMFLKSNQEKFPIHHNHVPCNMLPEVLINTILEVQKLSVNNQF